MRLPLPLLTAALVASIATPGAAQAAAPLPSGLPCIDVVVATVNCPTPPPGPAPAPAPAPAPELAVSCPGRDLVPTRANVRTVRKATLCLLNEQRTSRGLRKLKSVAPLQAVAGAYAKRMVRERFFEHTSPDGGTFLSRIKRTSYLRGGLKRWTVGENLAWGSGERATPERIVQAWMHSPPHKRNIVNRRFRELGLGVALGAPRASAGSGAAATYVNEFGMRRR
ncbi:MAG: hypothetical protein AVDCRST_MAG53-2034 [uncultured Solirubrobacteraceae bacterium]|uniref:SCP domain-containing protein n=1 Tax=uncultured Solirubrobacteraceae bacterium TaxID=1162706 RepID=A0A6J4SLD4_9ACTN|nr:MAG: hypothetical protein AVDCRST_MAG53-2034 [uncultured Solirubrobacteraceae bacterium]